MKKILIINGHPDKESFCFSLAESYKKGADSSGANCELVNINDLDFNPVLEYGYRKRMEFESDLFEMQEKIKNSEHLVFVYPTWWGTYPSLLKGFIDRVFVPRFAFKFHKNNLLWDKLLKGRSARLIVTMNTPQWLYALNYKSPGHNSMRKCILKFCGIKPVKITCFRSIRFSNEKKREKWLKKVEKLGRKQK